MAPKLTKQELRQVVDELDRCNGAAPINEHSSQRMIELPDNAIENKGTIAGLCANITSLSM